jgi:hypothetical protein
VEEAPGSRGSRGCSSGSCAVADLFGVAGIDISFVDELPAVSPRADDLHLGELVALADLDELVAFEVQAPTELGEPDEIWFDEAPVGGAISFVYYPDAELKESGTTGVGALLTQFSGTLYPGFSKKLVESGDTTVDIVEVGGLDAYFISGGDHVVYIIDADGETRLSEGRLAGNVLVWEQDGKTFRLEADVGVRRALEIARSLTDL